MKAYAGIGSRETPPEYLHLAESLAKTLEHEGWTCRSGHAPGADQAFERGAQSHAELYLPWPDFESDVPRHPDLVYWPSLPPGGQFTIGHHVQANGFVVGEPSAQAYEIAAEHHPNYLNMKPGAKRLHARNSHQVLGADLKSPATFVVCWTKDAIETGGTAQAMRIAKAHEIPIFNLADLDDFLRVSEYLPG